MAAREVTSAPENPMPSREKTAFRRKLLAWFRNNARDLPWRRTRDAYAVWLSEILLQQTRMEQGVPYYERFIGALPDVQSLAAASEDEVLKLWEGLGYYTRARNLHKAAKQVVNELDGLLPRTAEAWQRLPGVGRYTANAIASIAFGEAVPVLDGNVKRVLARLFNIGECIDDTSTTNVLWERADELLARRAPGTFNEAMMELGARVCAPRSPQCGECPVRTHCRARAEGIQRDLPVRRKKKSIPHKRFGVAVIENEGQFLVMRRPSEGLLGGLWQFPMEEVRQGEGYGRAVGRLAEEKLGINILICKPIASVEHVYSHFSERLVVYRCLWLEGEPLESFAGTLAWARRGELERYAFTGAQRKFLHML